MQVGIVFPEHLQAVWEQVETIVREHGEEWLDVVELRDIVLRLSTGDLHLWLGTEEQKAELVMVCGWERHGKKSFYHILWIGGERMKAYMEKGLPLVEEYAGLCGAEEVVFEGRDGWAKLLEPKGYEQSLMMRKDVTSFRRN